MTRRLEVLATGPAALVQDVGRIGHLAVGVGRSGAADRGAYTLGARLMGNDGGQAAVEVTFGGLRVRAHGDLVACLTGAPSPATVAGRPVALNAPFELRDTQLLELGTPTSGLRTYLSVRGGIDVPAVLGSRSTDTMSGVGPAPLRPGDVLPVGSTPGTGPTVDVAPIAGPTAGEVLIRVTPGPRQDWFADPAAFTGPWVVSDRSDRKGVRLRGEPLRRTPQHEGTELPSEGMVRGAVQVPPSGEPVVFLNDHPVTGGYPVIGVVPAADVDLLAQALPGQGVRFRWA